MLKKAICLTLAAALLLLAGCASNAPSGSKMKTLAEIRDEKENVQKIAEKYNNLDLSNTRFYVPDVDKLGGFTVDLSASVEEKNQVLFDAVERIVGETPNDSELRCWNTPTFDWMPYSEAKNLPDKSALRSLQYRSDKVTMTVEYWGCISYDFIDYENVPITDMGNYDYLFYEPLIKKYDLLAGDPADDVYELQGGEISVKDAVGLMQSELEASPFCMIGPQLVPTRASVHKLGEKYAIDAVFYYKYNDVLLDHHDYAINLETDEHDYFKDKITVDIAMARNNQIDQLSFARLGEFKSTDESYDRFISLESFLSMMSEKLTGNSKFTIDSVELLYGVERIYPEGYEAMTMEEKSGIDPLGFKSRPIWVAYIPHSGIQQAEQMCVRADAITGELGLFWGSEAWEH